jgi:hypothetical protein
MPVSLHYPENRGERIFISGATALYEGKIVCQFTILLAQLLLAKASGLALNANPIPNM